MEALEEKLRHRLENLPPDVDDVRFLSLPLFLCACACVCVWVVS